MGSSTVPTHGYQWTTIIVWVIIALISHMASSADNKTMMRVYTALLFVMFIIQAVLCLQYNIQVNNLTRINHVKEGAEDSAGDPVVAENGHHLNHGKFVLDKCYGSYYANIFGFVHKPGENTVDQGGNFQWATSISNVAKGVEESDLDTEDTYIKAPYKRAFRLGVRYYYTMFSGVFASVFSLVVVVNMAMVFFYDDSLTQSGDSKYSFASGSSLF